MLIDDLLELIKNVDEVLSDALHAWEHIPATDAMHAVVMRGLQHAWLIWPKLYEWKRR